jgi:hypothetical protein
MDVEKLKPDSALRTNALAEALTKKGYPTAPATLATKRSRGGGPPYRRWGRIPIYTWGEALEWGSTDWVSRVARRPRKMSLLPRRPPTCRLGRQ